MIENIYVESSRSRPTRAVSRDRRSRQFSRRGERAEINATDPELERSAAGDRGWLEAVRACRPRRKAYPRRRISPAAGAADRQRGGTDAPRTGCFQAAEQCLP